MGSDKRTPDDTSRVSTNRSAINPGDEAAVGTSGTGENVCPDCKGSGRLNNAPCRLCGGTGKVIKGVGGG
jgi:DnaJ-class molecular chaperone